MSLTIPVLSRTPNLLKELAKTVPHVNFHEVKDSEADPLFKNAEIIIADFNLLGPHLYNLPKTKWVQGTWAGLDSLNPFFKKDQPLNYNITRFTGEHFGKMMGEYVITNIVNYERDFFAVKQNQELKKWDTQGKIHSYRVISDLTVGILGVGNIGNRIGKMLSTLGANILAFGRRASLPTGEEYSHITKYHSTEALADLLRESDYVVNVLPKTPETTGLLDGDILKNCAEKKTVLINIGRSNILSETSIIKALNNKWISAIVLDVFDTEPLPQDNPLWSTPNVFITPHVSGVSRAQDIAQQFKTNLELYTKKLPIPAVVDLTKGY